MKTFMLIALLNVQPYDDTLILDFHLSLEDCEQRISELQPMAWRMDLDLVCEREE